MDNALIIGASGGIGAALCAELETRGVAVTALSRAQDGLDLTDEALVAEVLGAQSGPFDLVFVATGALVIDGHPPEKSLSALSAKGLADQFAVNAIGPALVLKHARRLLPRDRRAVFAAMSARVGSIGDNRLGGWYGYRAAKAALNQLIHGAAIEMARTHRHLACVCLHPGTVATRFTSGYQDRHETVAPEVAAARLIDVIEGVRASDSGRFLDYAGREIPW